LKFVVIYINQIREAHEKLKKMADGKYCTTRYEISKYTHMDEDAVDCCLYIEGFKHCVAIDFKTALAKMKAQIATGKVEEEQEEE